MDWFDITALLADNSYPGRGIVVGLCPDGCTAALAYFIMGRSASSRNRAFFRNGKDLGIHMLDERKVADPSLILYAPLRTLPRAIIVSNGDQTDTVRDALSDGLSFEQALRARRFEPDAPHFTPRISGLLALDEPFAYKLSILKSGDAQGNAAFRQTFEYEPVKGLGHFIHTYQSDANPLPSFSGEPVPVHIPGDICELAEGMWDALNAQNKVALYVRYTDVFSGAYRDRLFNKYISED